MLLKPDIFIQRPFENNIFSFDGEDFELVEENSNHRHRSAGLGNYQGNAFTTGCDPDYLFNDEFYEDCGKKSEILNLSSLTWSTAPEFPYAR